MYTFLVIVQVLVAAALIGLILLQQGKGADAGAAFGSGASGTVFGARGAANFLTRMTEWLAAAFFITSLALAYLVHGQRSGGSVVDQLPAATQSAPAPVSGDAVPAVPTSAPASASTSAPAAPESAAPSTPAVPSEGTAQPAPDTKPKIPE